MSGGNSRTLNFKASNLPTPVTLMLMFNPPASGQLYQTLFPVCFKVIKLGTGANASASVTWTINTAFFTPQIDVGNLVSSSSSALCSTGEQCVVTADSAGDLVVGNATAGAPGTLVCQNGTPSPISIGIGSSNATGGDVKPALTWTGVPAKNSVVAQLTPVLLIYSTKDYKETQLIKGAINSPNLFPVVDGPGVNLIGLGPETTYTVSIDPASGNIVFANA